MSGEPTQYSDEDRIALRTALVLAFNAYEKTGATTGEPPTKLYVEAEIEWDGQFEARRYRWMCLDRLNLAELQRTVKALRADLQRGAARSVDDLPAMLTQALTRRYRAQVRLRKVGKILLRP